MFVSSGWLMPIQRSTPTEDLGSSSSKHLHFGGVPKKDKTPVAGKNREWHSKREAFEAVATSSQSRLNNIRKCKDVISNNQQPTTIANKQQPGPCTCFPSVGMFLPQSACWVSCLVNSTSWRVSVVMFAQKNHWKIGENTTQNNKSYGLMV